MKRSEKFKQTADSAIHRPEQLEYARAYELVHDVLDKMNTNGAFADESTGTQKQMTRIINSMLKGIGRCTTKAYTQKKLQPRKKTPSRKVTTVFSIDIGNPKQRKIRGKRGNE